MMFWWHQQSCANLDCIVAKQPQLGIEREAAVLIILLGSRRNTTTCRRTTYEQPVLTEIISYIKSLFNIVPHIRPQ